MKISAAIITFNEEKNIADCIDSLREVADEIIVVDSFSNDLTQEICREKQVTFIQNKFDGHIEQKNFAISQCQYDYVLSLDADERLSTTLSRSIKTLKEKPQTTKKQAFKFNRLSNFCGKWVHHSGWYPDVKTRLFHKDIAKWGGENPHDKIILQKGGELKHLEGDLLHYTFHTTEQHQQQIDKFSTIAAEAKFRKGEKSNWIKIYVKSVAKWLRTFVVKSGYKDGKLGLYLANSSYRATYLKYLKLKSLHEQN